MIILSRIEKVSENPGEVSRQQTENDWNAGKARASSALRSNAM
jgi:hypothetical protein